MAYNGPRGTGFTSLADYLNLNREQAQSMGDALAGDVAARGTASQNAIHGYGSNFSRQVAAGTPQYSEDGITTEEQAKKAAEGATYKGPQAWDAETARSLGTQAADASQRARLAASDYGRGTLLQQRYAPNGGYSAGAAGLDAFLAGRGMGNRGAEGVSKFGELQKMLGTEQTAGANAVTAAQGTAKNVQDRYNALADSLHRDPNKHPLTAPMNPQYQAQLDAAARANGQQVMSPDSTVTPDKKGGGNGEDPLAETDNAVHRRPKVTGRYVYSGY